MTSTFAGGAAGALTDYFRSHGQSSVGEALFNGAIGAVIVFVLYASVNLVRSVWLEHKSETRGTTMQGTWGALIVLVILAAFGAGGMFAYEDARSTIVLKAPLPNESQMKELTDCKANLASYAKPESPISLRHRTIKLADDLDAFYRQRMIGSPAYTSTDPNAAQEFQALNKYNRDTQELCAAKFKVRITGIVQDLRGKELDIGMMDKVVDAQGCIGLWGGGNDIKELRNMAHWLNADDTKEKF